MSGGTVLLIMFLVIALILVFGLAYALVRARANAVTKLHTIVEAFEDERAINNEKHALQIKRLQAKLSITLLRRNKKAPREYRMYTCDCGRRNCHITFLVPTDHLQLTRNGRGFYIATNCPNLAHYAENEKLYTESVAVFDSDYVYFEPTVPI